MSRIRGKDTTPDHDSHNEDIGLGHPSGGGLGKPKVIRALLRHLGYRFRSHVRIPITATIGRKKAQNAQKDLLSASTMSLVRGSGRRWRSRVRVVGEKQISVAGNTGEVSMKPRALRLITPDFILPKHRIAIFVQAVTGIVITL